MRGWLKEQRLKSKLSQQDVSGKMNITQQYYSSIENGKRQKDLPLSIIQKLAEIFNVSTDWIIEQENNNKTA